MIFTDRSRQEEGLQVCLRARYRVADMGYKTPCHIWTGKPAKKTGYGRVREDGKLWYAHRWVWRKAKRKLPRNLTLDHLCMVRTCINLDHLEVVTIKVNILRGGGPTAINARKTVCIRGHKLEGSNLYVIKATGYRQCRACRPLRGRAA